MVTTSSRSHGGRVVILHPSAHTEQRPQTRSKRRNAKKHNHPSQHPRAAASRLAVVSSSVPTHHHTQPENPPSPNPQRERHVGRYSQWTELNKQLSQTPSTMHESLVVRTSTTPASLHGEALRTHDLLTRKSNRSHNLVRAFTAFTPLHSMCNKKILRMCPCVCQRLYLQSSCAPQESLKKATAERAD
ncbi:hypothetical protein TcCL_NonESM09413, partial [Trypanosoma cruzi]